MQRPSAKESGCVTARQSSENIVNITYIGFFSGGPKIQHFFAYLCLCAGPPVCFFKPGTLALDKWLIQHHFKNKVPCPHPECSYLLSHSHSPLMGTAKMWQGLISNAVKMSHTFNIALSIIRNTHCRHTPQH